MPLPALLLEEDLVVVVAWQHWVFVAIELMAQITVAGWILVRRPRRPSTNLTWIMVIMLLPVIGVLMYLMVGEAHLGRLRRRRHKAIVDSIRARGLRYGGMGLYPPLPQQHQAVTSLVESVGGLPVRGGNGIRLFHDSEEVIASLVADIDAATLHAHLLFYIFEPDKSGNAVGEALMRAAGRGVACRLLVDAVGSRTLLKSSLLTRMRQAGVRVVAALPAHIARAALSRIDLRNHRKLAVFDGVIGYTGSQNIVDASFAPKPGFGPWVDASLRIEGPAVMDLAELFVEDWYLDSDEDLTDTLELEPRFMEDGVALQIMPTGPDDEHEAMRLVAQSAFHLAREELILTTPYFVPGEAEVVALCTAARRGVRTSLVVPRRNDSPLVAAASRALYQELLSSGVEIYEYTAGLLHAKVMTIDRNVALVGTANFDRRSFELNFEVSAVVYDSDFASKVRFLQRTYMHESEQVDARAWHRRPWQRRLLENAAGVLSPLL